MIFNENLGHFGIKIANFTNFCETIGAKTHVNPSAPQHKCWGKPCTRTVQGLPSAQDFGAAEWVKIAYEEENIWKIRYLLSMMRS